MRIVALIIGILAGLMLGGMLGLLVGLGALSIPGFGPLIAAGTLATTFGTASIGAIAGALIRGLIALGLTYGTNHRTTSRRDT